MSICTAASCGGWSLLEGDRFCGWCGASVVALGLTLERPHDGAWQTVCPPLVSRDTQAVLRVRIEHQGQAGSLHVEHAGIEVGVAWLELAPDFDDGVELLPGESVLADVVRLDVPPHDDVTHVAPVRVVTPEGLEASVELRISPQPRLRFEVPTEPVLLREGRESLVSCALVLERGQTVLDAPPALDCDWCVLEIAPDARFPLELRPEGPARVACTLRVLDGAAEWMESTGRAERSGGLTVAARGRDDVPLALDFTLRFALAPRLWLERFRDAERTDHTLIRGVTDRAPIELWLYNGLPGARGHQPLEVRRVESQAAWLRLEGAALPVVLESGQGSRFAAHVEASGVGASGVATLFFDTSDGGARQLHLGVRVMEPAEYGGWLVVDFGTSNTCCALVDDETGEVRLLALEGGRAEGPSAQLPSVVRYLRATPERAYEVGEGPRALLFDAASARSIVASAKRRLGRGCFTFAVTPKEQPGHTEEIAPWEVARDVYSTVLRMATATLAREAASGRRNGRSREVHLRRIVMTHPSRFTHHQMSDLKKALHEAAADVLQAPVKVHTMHEPIGAGYDFLGDWKWLAARHAALGHDDIAYSLLVYDFGGGTVDITLMQVSSKRSRRAVLPQPASSTPAALDDGQKSAALERLFGDAGVMRRALRGYVLDRFQAVVGASAVPLMLANGTPAVDEAADDNNRLLDMFVGATAPALSRELLLGDPARWTRFCRNPSVPPSLSLMCGQGGQIADCDVRRAHLFPTARELGEYLMREGLPAAALPLNEEDHPYSYDVTPTLLGAAGDRSLGGDDVTAWLLEMLVHAFEEAARRVRGVDDVVLPVDPGRVPPHQAAEARQNRLQLSGWAELYKIALSNGAGRPERLPSLIFWVEGKRMPLAPHDLVTTARLPSLAEIEVRLVPRMHDTLRVARDMHERRGIASPDVIVRAGMASRLPTVEVVLRQAYPGAEHHAPERPKECVVTGACRAVQGAVRSRNSLLRIRQARALTATTTRLGFLENDGQTFFREVIGAGEEVPPEGIRRDRPIVLGYAGARIFIKENGGADDRLVLPDGTRNPDIEDVMTLSPDIPDDVPLEDLEAATLEFHLAVSLDLTVTLRIPGVPPIDLTGEVGRNE